MTGSNIIVWDLDDTLVHTTFITKEDALLLETDPKYNFLKGRSVIKKIVDIRDDGHIGTGDISYALIIFRPGAHEIINYSLENFDKVVIWSAGHKRYVRTVVGLLIDSSHINYSKKKIEVLSREDCNEIAGTTVLKDLKSKGFDLCKTIMVDDNRTTYRNNLENAIPINSYNPNIKKEHIDYKDPALYELMIWLKTNNLHNVSNVKSIDKSNIYSTPIH